jgi:hypothetical protein
VPFTEPAAADFEHVFQSATFREQPPAKLRADAYLPSFAKIAGLWLATFESRFSEAGRPRDRAAAWARIIFS